MTCTWGQGQNRFKFFFSLCCLLSLDNIRFFFLKIFVDDLKINQSVCILICIFFSHSNLVYE